jgi:hypothetical protein
MGNSAEVGRTGRGRLFDEEGWRCYLAYFNCFNEGRFYDAHDALEPFWLRIRAGSDGRFCKGLIQLAGAFVHVQKGRTGPALSLLGRARFHLDPFQPEHCRLRVSKVLELIQAWEDHIVRGSDPRDLLTGAARPRLRLEAGDLERA